MVVQSNLEVLRDVFDSFANKEKKGFATVANGNTTVVVTHNYGNVSYRAFVTPFDDPGGRWWVTNKTSTSFTINLQVAAGGLGVRFDWLVKGD